jgi:hypothetical protein
LAIFKIFLKKFGGYFVNPKRIYERIFLLKNIYSQSTTYLTKFEKTNGTPEGGGAC